MPPVTASGDTPTVHARRGWRVARLTVRAVLALILVALVALVAIRLVTGGFEVARTAAGDEPVSHSPGGAATVSERVRRGRTRIDGDGQAPDGAEVDEYDLLVTGAIAASVREAVRDTTPETPPMADDPDATLAAAPVAPTAPEPTAGDASEDREDRPLGRLALPGGGTFDIRGRVLIGRRPARPDDVPAVLLAVPSPHDDVSRTHLEITMAGAGLAARDLGSTNGTLLRRAGRSASRLTPWASHPLAVGDELDLGDGAVLRLLDSP